ncbi:MAG: hypothetical protein D6692_13850 [Planctomycetota bacterium]|nr:MAG: hypothetical protein D6692_13850 [Planctomycetota bacterium]
MEVLTLGAEEVAGLFMLTSVAIFGISAGVAHSMYKTRQREQTKREIAAYVAEGSMTPEQGERLLRAGGEQ